MIASSFQTSTPNGKHYNIHYMVWGEENDPSKTLVCVHGLTGNAQDFTYVGETLEKLGYRIAALDILGRHKSDYVDDPQDYNFTQYHHDLDLFLKELGCTTPQSCDWLGVSMGGLLGIQNAGLENSPIRTLILSDVGPAVPQFDLNFIYKYINVPDPTFKSLDEALALYKLSAGTPYSRGILDDNQWMDLVKFALKQRPDGTYTRNYDGRIAEVFATNPLGNIDLWESWENIVQPTLLIRGELSTLCSPKLTDEMRTRKPNDLFEIATVEKSGHVPSLFRTEQIKLISDFLAKSSAMAA